MATNEPAVLPQACVSPEQRLLTVRVISKCIAVKRARRTLTPSGGVNSPRSIRPIPRARCSGLFESSSETAACNVDCRARSIAREIRASRVQNYRRFMDRI
eukprot:6187835-Pleurochrysis_carterae.AAC.4